MTKLTSPVANMVWKALYFFWLGIFVIEAFLDINPTRVMVYDTSFSISYYVYLTFFDLLHFLSIGFVILGIGAFLFAFSKYRFVPIALAGFAVAFYYELVMSKTLMAYYQSTYACHAVSSSFGGFGYVCPLANMVLGDPNIPLQGDVVALIAFSIAVFSFGMSRLSQPARVAIAEMLIFGSGVICAFEISIYFYESAFYTAQVTYYQGLIYLERLTNQELLALSTGVLLTALAARVVYWQRRSEKTIWRPILRFIVSK